MVWHAGDQSNLTLVKASLSNSPENAESEDAATDERLEAELVPTILFTMGPKELECIMSNALEWSIRSWAVGNRVVSLDGSSKGW